MKYLFIVLVLGVLLFGGNYLAGDQAAKQKQAEEEAALASAEPAPNTLSGKLDLSVQGLVKAPEYIFSQIGLTELNLSNNSLEGSLQAEIRHLQNLKILNLSTNKFTGVPAEIGQLKNLEVLDLSNNQLTGLPYELGNLTKLKLLDLSGNNYSEADLAIIQSTLSASTVVKTSK